MVPQFNALRLVPSHFCTKIVCMSDMLLEPPITRVSIPDIIGIDTAFDLQLTQGFYTLLISYICIQYVRNEI